jgi:hypothetical protein
LGKNKIFNSKNIPIIIIIISLICFIGIIVLLFTFFNKKEDTQIPRYKKTEEQKGKNSNNIKEKVERFKKNVNIDSPEINKVIQNPDINAESLGNLTAIMDEEKSFNNGKFRVKESFRKSYVYVFKFYI